MSELKIINYTDKGRVVQNVKTCIFCVVRNQLFASLAVRRCQLQNNTICAAITKFISGGGVVLKRDFDEFNATTLFMEKDGRTEELI